MAEGRASQGDGEAGPRIGRRGFIGAGLAGAGAALIAPASGAAAQSAQTVADPQHGRPKQHQKHLHRTAPKGSAGQIPHLPIKAFFPNLPAIPVDLVGMAETLVRLGLRSEQVIQAKQGLTRLFTIDGRTETGYAFLYGDTNAAAKTTAWTELEKNLRTDPEQVVTEHIVKPIREKKGPRPLQLAGTPDALSLEQPEQFSISWTSFPDVYHDGLPSLPTWTSSLTDADAATEQFWPMIAQHGFGYNLIIPEKVTGASVNAVRRNFRSAWTRQHAAAAADGALYVIDMTRFQQFEPQTVAGAPRFVPSTITLLKQDPQTKRLEPIAVTVSGYRGQNRRMYTRANSTDGAWLYALQAAKVSITVFGVWLGHVYHWHLVTAAMQMTMFNTFQTSHPIYQLLAPQSKFCIPFDDVLLLLWSEIAPPTPMANFLQFLELTNDYAAGRNYFDDDPKVTLKQLGLTQADFTTGAPWDQYPVVQRLLAIWDFVEAYVSTFVDTSYASDSAVANDTQLQSWIATSSAGDEGNIQGLPKVNTRAELQRVLTSLVYRITAHGISRLNSTANPALTFTANYPHCLQRTDIPSQNASINTKQLLSYLPNTETIGEALNFYSIFVFSPPYESNIPLTGTATELFFPGGPGEPRNEALVKLRRSLAAFINDYQPTTPQRFQWPRNIET
jgi:hypothetical protein